MEERRYGQIIKWLTGALVLLFALLGGAILFAVLSGVMLLVWSEL